MAVASPPPMQSATTAGAQAGRNSGYPGAALAAPSLRSWKNSPVTAFDAPWLASIASCGIGVYSVHNSTFDVMITAALGLLGYILIRVGCEPAPLTLGFVLGPLMEENLRRSMLLSRGDPSVFFTRPISAMLLALSALLLLTLILPALRKQREVAFQD